MQRVCYRFSQFLMNGLIVLSKTRWISILVFWQTCFKIHFTKAPNIGGKSTKRCRKNIASGIITSMFLDYKSVCAFQAPLVAWMLEI